MGFYLLEHPNPHGPHHYETRRTCQHGLSRPHLIVIHTAETLPDFSGPDIAAENVAAYGASTDRAVSWHWTVDSDSSIPMLPEEATAWHVRGFNSCSIGLEIATRAAAWLSTPAAWKEATLDRVARVCADACARWTINPRLLTRADVDAGRSGLVGHNVLDPSRRTDPGAGFDWQTLTGKVRWYLARRDGGGAVAAFNDVAGHWAEQAIRHAIATGVMVGDGYTWRPDDPISRAEIAAILERLGLLTQPTG